MNANGQASQAVVEEVKRDTARHVEMARQNAQASNERREHLTANFRQQQAAKDENRRKQVNYASNETDVQGAGGSWKVASGYSNYYRNSQTGTIVGTNSAYSPGVNFTPLTEH